MFFLLHDLTRLSQKLIKATAATFPFLGEEMKVTTTAPQEFNPGAAWRCWVAPQSHRLQGQPGAESAQVKPPRSRKARLRRAFCQTWKPPDPVASGPETGRDTLPLLGPRLIPGLPADITDGASWLWHLPSNFCQVVTLHITNGLSSILLQASSFPPWHSQPSLSNTEAPLPRRLRY